MFCSFMKRRTKKKVLQNSPLHTTRVTVVRTKAIVVDTTQTESIVKSRCDRDTCSNLYGVLEQ